MEVNQFKPRLIIGLGNPDKEYEKTYHNVGFLAVDFLAANPEKFKIQNSKFKILKSEVYMNESGDFVKKTVKQNNVKPGEILIIHDDSDIKIGEYKFSFGRSSAGHKGVQSIIDSLKTKNFWRLRIGVGHEPTRTPRGLVRKKAGEIVLKKIPKTDMENLNKVFKKISENLTCYE
ncbi:MAG: aminoacyl-tRNA hydrolase [Spirochaetota bacterium]